MKQHNDQAPLRACYDRATAAVVIRDLAVNDRAVVAESRRWSAGQRGPAVGEEDMADVELSTFVTQAVIVGAHAIGSAGGIQDTFNLEQLVSDVGARTAASTSKVIDTTNEVVNSAAEAMRKVSAEAKDAIIEAGQHARRRFADNVDSARKNDPDDPTSPMSKHSRALHQRQETLAATLERNHRDLATKVAELTNAVKLTSAAKEATAAMAGITPLKGESYATGIHEVMAQIAVGLGDEYADTSAVPGAIPRNKKGDGVLTIDGGRARLVLEMTNSKRSSWNDYLDEAERNRNAAASLGLVCEPAQNNGSTIRCLGSRRIVLAFDPVTDDPELLRTVIQLLRISALTASSREDRDGIHTAEEKIAEALGMLDKIDEIRKVAGTLRLHAGKIEQQSDDVRTALTRLLSQAQSALSVAADDAA